MTTIKFFKENNTYVGFECNGHTGYAESGTDILCSAISALTQSTALGITKVLKLQANIEVLEEDAYFKVMLNSKNDEANILFKTLKLSLEDIKIGNEKYIQILEVKRSLQ